MKKQEENKQEDIRDLLDELYDIDNLKNDLDEVLNLERITVSESLIQATLAKASQPKEDNIIPYAQKVTGKRRSIPFRYGMIAACACILVVAGIQLVTKVPLEMGSSKNDSNYEATAESSTESDGMVYDETEDTSEDKTSLDVSDASESTVIVPSVFNVEADSNYYSIKVGEIKEIAIYDENGVVIHSDTDSSYIESIYNAFANIDSDEFEEVQNQEHKGQYVREYAIIADEGLAWTELHLWIGSTDQETYVVTRELKTSDGETITHQITDVSAEVIMNIIDTAP
ncbi:hypothetical protein [Anaerosporobacter sp.]